MIHHIAQPLAWIAEGALLRQYAVQRWPHLSQWFTGRSPMVDAAEVGTLAATGLTRELFTWATKGVPQWLN